MNRFLLASVVLTFAFAACAPLNHRDRNFLQGRGISPALHEKMVHHEPLTVDEIIELSQKGVPGRFIVHYLQPTYFVYKLHPSDVDQMRKAGVEDGVIRYLASTPSMFSPTAGTYWYEDDPHFNDFTRSYSRY